MSGDETPVKGGTLRVGVTPEVDGLNPTTSALNSTGLTISRAVFDSLVGLDEDGGWVPKIAESFEPSDDFSEWTMTLRPDVMFHDGTPLDASAVAVNFEAQHDDALVGNAIRPYYDAENPITVIDDLTVTYRLSIPNANWPYTLSTQLGLMASPTWLEATKDNQSLNQEPVGAGPFKFESRAQDSMTKVVRNDDYFAQPAWLDAIEFYPMNDDAQRIDQFLGGALDEVITYDTVQAGALADASGEGTEFWTVVEDEGIHSMLMINSSVAPFDDIRVREALTLSTPVTIVNERINEGLAEPSNQMVGPDSPYFNPDIEQITDDSDAAKPLVQDYCSDVPENCTDGRIDMNYDYAGPNAHRSRLADLFSEGWADNFNVNVTQSPSDSVTLNAALGSYHVIYWEQFVQRDPYYDRVWIGCETIGDISLNWQRDCSEERDQLLDEGQASTEAAVREGNIQQISQTLTDAKTFVFLSRLQPTNAFSNKVRGVCDQTNVDGVEFACAVDLIHFYEQIWLA